jgi:hypothetical protein
MLIMICEYADKLTWRHCSFRLLGFLLPCPRGSWHALGVLANAKRKVNVRVEKLFSRAHSCVGGLNRRYCLTSPRISFPLSDVAVRD